MNHRSLAINCVGTAPEDDNPSGEKWKVDDRRGLAFRPVCLCRINSI